VDDEDCEIGKINESKPVTSRNKNQAIKRMEEVKNRSKKKSNDLRCVMLERTEVVNWVID